MSGRSSNPQRNLTLAALGALAVASAATPAFAQTSERDAILKCLLEKVRVPEAMGEGVTIDRVSVSAATYTAIMPDGSSIEIRAPSVQFGESMPAMAYNIDGLADPAARSALKEKGLKAAASSAVCFAPGGR